MYFLWERRYRHGAGLSDLCISPQLRPDPSGIQESCGVQTASALPCRDARKYSFIRLNDTMQYYLNQFKLNFTSIEFNKEYLFVFIIDIKKRPPRISRF